MPSDTSPTAVTLRFFHYPNYWEMESAEARTYDELLNRLDDVFQRHYLSLANPVLLFVHKENGERFGVGLGQADSTVIYVSADDSYWYSVGDEDAEGTAVFLCPDWTEIAAARLVSGDKAKIALREWLEKGRMTDAIKWTDELL